VVAQFHHFGLLLAQDVCEVRGLGELQLGGRLSFFLLQRTVQQDDSGILDFSAHVGVSDVFVDHDALQHARVFNQSSGDLLDTSLLFDIDFVCPTAFRLVDLDGAHTLQRQLGH